MPSLGRPTLRQNTAFRTIELPFLLYLRPVLIYNVQQICGRWYLHAMAESRLATLTRSQAMQSILRVAHVTLI
jgi:hypothetical protein